MKSSLNIYSAIKVLLLVSLIIPLAGFGKKEAPDSPSDNRMSDMWYKDASAKSLVNDYLKTNRVGKAVFLADGRLIVVAQASISSSGSLLKGQTIAKLRAMSEVCQFLYGSKLIHLSSTYGSEVSGSSRLKPVPAFASLPMKSEQSAEYSVEDAHGVLSVKLKEVYKDATYTSTFKERISMAEDGSVEAEISMKEVHREKRRIWEFNTMTQCSGKIRGLSEISSWRKGDSIYRAFLLPAQPLYAKTKQSGKQINHLRQKNNNKENYDN